MTRLTRKEMHAQTRDRLIQTAHRLFLSEGYATTSLEKVAAEAGYSKGAVYSNFATKYELGLVVLDLVRLERANSLVYAITAAEGIQQKLAAFDAWADTTLGDEGWTVLEVEFAASSRHIAGVRDELASRRTTLTSILAAAIAKEAERLEITLRLSAEQLAVRLMALGIGLGVQRAFDPAVPAHALGDLIREAFDIGPLTKAETSSESVATE